uniref:Uncharacterized protein n=1 Tax=Rhizophora mucronata TaxID=61149 RepID=A0A2P2P8K6_RHIMU
MLVSLIFDISLPSLSESLVSQ